MKFLRCLVPLIALSLHAQVASQANSGYKTEEQRQNVAKGQKIAEIGNSDSPQVKLHFEIRRLGEPVDPVKFLPERRS